MDELPDRPAGRGSAPASRAEPKATHELLPLLYDELRRLARSRLAREAPGQTLTPTALVHEVYLRLAGPGDADWANRAHFFAAAAEAMRRILIERARRRRRARHGGGQLRVTLDDRIPDEIGDAERLLAFDDALGRLEAQDPDMAAVVKLHRFAGLSLEETAAALGISDRTVSRRWTAARAWLRRAVLEGEERGSSPRRSAGEKKPGAHAAPGTQERRRSE